MLRISPERKHELSAQGGLKVYVEGLSDMALTSPEAQRLVFNYVKEAGFKDYGMSKLTNLEPLDGSIEFPHIGYWELTPRQWHQGQVVTL